MKQAIILLGHGSQNPEAHQEFDLLLEEVRRVRPGQEIGIAYLQLRSPDLLTAVADLVRQGFDHLVIIPVFLFAGNHIREDIPAALQVARQNFPDVSIYLGRHLGPDRAMGRIVDERINEAIYKYEYQIDPQRIEQTSFQLIEKELAGRYFSEPEKEIVKRVIHATADPGFVDLVDFHPQAVQAGITALRDGVGIITDVRMSMVGIGQQLTSKFGSTVACSIDDPHVKEVAGQTGQTRSMVAIAQACAGMKRGIVVIGNAPTALFQLSTMVESGVARPDLIIGVPVGFVGAKESKEVLKGLGIPYIRTIGPRGGSPVAVAIVHGLAKLAEQIV